MTDRSHLPGATDKHVALVELVNRVVDRGVVVSGDVTISVADIDLLYLGIRLLLTSVDRLEDTRGGRRAERRAPSEDA